MTTKVTSEFLHQAIISDHTEVSAASADHILIHDASDNTLKKALVSTITGSGTTINNNADNRIITGSGTSGTLEAETDLTYSGGANAVGTLEKATSHLSLKASNSLFLKRGATNQVSFYKGSDAAAHFSISTPEISGSTNQTELMHRESGGDLILSAVATGGAIRRGITIKGDSNGDIELIGDITKTSGDITIDVPGSINLDADNNGEVSFRDGGTEYGKIFSSSSDFAFEAGVQDKDIIFRGNDGGTAITPFKLDMSAGGRALFYSDLLALETAGQYLQVAGSSSNYWAIGSTGGNNTPGTASTTLAFHHYNGSAWNNEVEFDSSGNIVADGNVTAYSDERLKSNIQTLESGLDKVNQLRGVTYTKNEKENIGVIAQEVEKILPEIVVTGNTEQKLKSVDYGRLTAVLIEAVKELSQKIEKLEGK